MNILILGSGGREHAIAWKIAQSPLADSIFVSPGNGGTATTGGKISNVSDLCSDPAQAVAFAEHHNVELTVVGSEVPLSIGMVDAFMNAGLACFGPVFKAARLETSKAWSKQFMLRHGIPTAGFRTFQNISSAREYLDSTWHEIVIKVSGLAAGKGVIIPENRIEAHKALEDIFVGHIFGDAGNEVLVERRLHGREVSVLAFCDGHDVRLMPPARDHKRVGDHNTGPNTGGMGAIAPVPVGRKTLDAAEGILRKAVEGMLSEGTAYVGVLYVGLMETADGPRVLEFNCRFGDPETQVILPLLQTDLVEVMLACVNGTLKDTAVEWDSGFASTVVAAAPGYPGEYLKGLEISGLDEAARDTIVFHSGTKKADGKLVSSGGRVLTIVGLGDNLRASLETAYAGIGKVKFEGMHYRKDIGVAE